MVIEENSWKWATYNGKFLEKLQIWIRNVENESLKHFCDGTRNCVWYESMDVSSRSQRLNKENLENFKTNSNLKKKNLEKRKKNSRNIFVPDISMKRHIDFFDIS